MTVNHTLTIGTLPDTLNTLRDEVYRADDETFISKFRLLYFMVKVFRDVQRIIEKEEEALA